MAKKRTGSLKNIVPLMSIFPVVVFGIVISIVTSMSFRGIMYEKIEGELSEIAAMILDSYDAMSPDDYHLEQVGNVVAFYKGDEEITGNNKLIDAAKKSTEAEVTIFYMDTRMITTIREEGGGRLIGTGANSVIVKDVIEGQSDRFYNDVDINNVRYYAYYRPIINSDGSVIGMIAVAKPLAEVNELVSKAVLPLVFVTLVLLVLTGLISLRYSSTLVKTILGLEKSLSHVANGELNKSPDDKIIHRNDELGDMAKSIVQMQKSLHALIEEDALTELYNRRYAVKKLSSLMVMADTTGQKYTVTIADIDYFKKVNDTWGHDTGDDVLKAVAYCLKSYIKGRGFVARWGGEEFLLVHENYDLEETAECLKILQGDIYNIAVPTGEYGDIVKVTMSFGVAEGMPGLDMDSLIKMADENLYDAKEAGRDRIVALYPEDRNND